jgi:hypothetical protein
MARQKVPDLQAPKRRKQLALPVPWVAALVVAGVASLGAAAWDARSCVGELEEAQNALVKILELERKYEAKAGRFAPMAPCHFTDDGAATCVSRIGFSIIGTSHFAYRVDSDGETFIATAVGATDRHRGSVIRMDQTGRLDMSGAMCRE